MSFVFIAYNDQKESKYKKIRKSYVILTLYLPMGLGSESVRNVPYLVSIFVSFS